MQRIDVTEQWTAINGHPAAMQRFILDHYGADRTEKANYPYTALYKGENRLGYVNSADYPRVTAEGDRLFMELADLQESIDV